MNFEIVRLQTENEARECAAIMSSTDPWITLNRNFDQCLAVINDSINAVHLLKMKDEVAGFGIINLTGSLVGYIRTIAFKPEYRGQGLGTQLIQFLEQIIFKQHSNVFICVSLFNPRARMLYEKLGYEYVGELKNYIVNGHSEILLRKTIGPIMTFHPR